MILAIKTDKDPAEIYLLDASGEILRAKIWDAGRTLAKNLLAEIEKLIRKNSAAKPADANSRERFLLQQKGSDEPRNDGREESSRELRSAGFATRANFDSKKPFAKITGIIVFQGPGSFTGLRIGITVANAVAYAQNAAIVGAQNSAGRENWRETGLKKLRENLNDKIVLPEYGAAPHITAPKK